jgi:hypothetical protein
MRDKMEEGFPANLWFGDVLHAVRELQIEWDEQ